MTKSKDTGLAAIAHSTRKRPTIKSQPRGKTALAPAEENPPLELEGRPHRTSLTLDVGLWNCVLDTAHVLTKRMRATGRSHGRVTAVKLIETAFIAFHELPLEQQIELVRRHD